MVFRINNMFISFKIWVRIAGEDILIQLPTISSYFRNRHWLWWLVLKYILISSNLHWDLLLYLLKFWFGSWPGSSSHHLFNGNLNDNLRRCSLMLRLRVADLRRLISVGRENVERSKSLVLQRVFLFGNSFNVERNSTFKCWPLKQQIDVLYWLDFPC